jgi:hypothetical protein
LDRSEADPFDLVVLEEVIAIFGEASRRRLKNILEEGFVSLFKCPLRVISISTGGAAMNAIIKTEVAVKGRDHQNTKPSNVKTVFSASYPVTEATP